MTTPKPTPRQYIEVILTVPHLLLHIAFFAVGYIGIIHAVLDIWAFRGQRATGDIRTLTSNLFMTVFLMSLIAGALAIINRLRGIPEPDIPGDATSVDRLKVIARSPERLLHIGIWATALLGAGTSVLTVDIANSRPGITQIWSAWTGELFSVAAASLFLVAIAAFLVHAGKQPPSGGADDAETEDTTGAAEPGEPSRWSAWRASMAQFLVDPRRVLHFGIYLVAYLGVVSLVLSVWGNRNGATGVIWGGMLADLFTVAAAAGFLALAMLFLDWLRSGQAPREAEPGPDLTSRALAVFATPLTVLRAAIPVLATVGVLWTLVNLWTARNADPAAFWQVVSFDMLVVASVLSFMLALRAWLVQYEAARSGAQQPAGLLNDPTALLRVAVYVVAYIGLLHTVLAVWGVRGAGPLRVWEMLFDRALFLAAPVVMLVAFRALNPLLMGRLFPATEAAAAPATRRAPARTGAAAEPQAAEEGAATRTTRRRPSRTATATEDGEAKSE